MMLVVWIVMNVIAEMTTYLPMKGITLPYFTNRYVDSSLAFASGWNYWYAYAVLVAAEASAGTILLEYVRINSSPLCPIWAVPGVPGAL